MDSEAKKKDVTAKFHRHMDMIFKKVDVAQDLQKDKRYKDAVRLLAPEVKEVDELFQEGFLAETGECKFFSFDTPFGYMLYNFYERPQKEIRYAPYNYGRLYFAFGSILIDLQNIEGARKNLVKAMRWDPTNAEYVLEYAETYKRKGDFEKFLELTKDAFRFAYTRELLSRLYRNLGYYFVEKELWDVAIECFSLAYVYDDGEYSAMVIDNELRYIYDKSKRTETIHLNFDNLEKYAQQYDFPYGADGNVVLFAYHQGRMRFESKEYGDAKPWLKIAYNIALHDDAKKLLDEIERLEMAPKKGNMVN